ncbi:MAG: AsmA-like C-terminal domain-containing protein [Candidatus Scalindua sp.]
MPKPKVTLILIIIFSVIGCIFIGGYVALKTFTSEKAIKSRITKRFEALTGGKLTIEHAHFDLFKGLDLSNFKFEGKNPENLRLEVEKVFIRHEPLALLRGEILINSIMIVSPELFMVREKGAIWRFLNGVKALLDHSGLKYPTDQLRSGVIVKAANIHVFDKVIFRKGVLNIEKVDLFGQQIGGSLRDIIIKGIINDGLWKGLELNVDTNLATPELKLVAQTRDKTMTEELMKELPVIGEKFWKMYSPVGKFDFDCTLDFNNKDSKRKMDYLLELDVIDGEMTYIKWPFLLKHVNGKLEFSRKGTFLKSMKGDVQNEGQQSQGEIDAFFGAGSARKSINLTIPNFNITKKLLKMIPDVGEKVWKDYKPEGNIDLTIKYESDEDKSVTEYSAEAICKGIKARYPNIPYDLTNIVGLIKNDGKTIYLKNMSGYLLNGSKVNRTIFNGEMDLKSKEKRFMISIPNLDLTEEIIKSIPRKGEEIWSQNKPTGQVDLTIEYTGHEDSSKDEYIVTADCKGNEYESAIIPFKVSDIVGRIIIDKNNFQFKSLRGYVIAGNQLSHVTGNGTLSLRNKNKKALYDVTDLKVTEDILDKFPELLKNGKIKIEPVGRLDVIFEDEINDVMGVDRHAVIIDTKGCGIGFTNFPFSISDIDGRINIEGEQLTSRNFSGICYGGKVNGSIKLDSISLNGAYEGELNFEKVSLQKLMEGFSKGQQEWAGLCEGNIEFQGTGKGLDNFTAKGNAKLREGYLSELPALLSILKLLNLSVPKREAFHTANIKYSIKDKVVDIEELEVFSDSIELGCVGTAGFDGTIDLTVVAGLNKETFSQIPFIGGLMDFVVGGVRKTLTKVQITGTLSNPKSTMIGLKPLTSPIKRIIDVLSPAGENKEEDAKEDTKQKEDAKHAEENM